MDNFKEKLHNTPLWLINLISILSGVVTIITPIIGIVATIITGEKIGTITKVAFVSVFSFACILFFRMKKYRQLALKRMSVTSEKFHRLTHESRNVFFDVLHSYKTKSLTENELDTLYQKYIGNVLDDLCEVLNSFTEKKICACVKLFTYTEDEEIIDKNYSKLVTFCRSRNSSTNRNNYVSRNKKEIFLKDNTDFRDIVDDEKEKDYFYEADLKKYDEELKKIGEKYRNTNDNWEQYYRGTIVVPIQIEFKRLYHQKKNDSYHLIGFVCVDSLDTDAFKEEQEKYNVDIVKAYADLIYVFLDEYKYYMKRLREPVKA